MKGRVRYTFEIATRRDDQTWHVLVARTGLFSRRPKATARSIVERWSHEQQGQLRGGRVVIGGRRAAVPKHFDATVRIRVLAGDGSGRQLAVAFIGIDRVAREDGARRSDPRTARDEYAVPDLPRAEHLAGQGRG